MSLEVEIRSPDGEVFSGASASVRLPGVMGSLGILARHAPMIAALEMGFARVTTTTGVVHEFVTGEGFVEVAADRVLVLVDSGEYTGRIDIARAEAAAERAKERLASSDAEVDEARAQAALARATTRLKYASREPAPNS